MKKLWCGTISMILVVVMLINMLPLNVLAIDNNSTIEVGEEPIMQETIPVIDSTNIEQIYEEKPAYVVEEDVGKRSEFYKEFILSNGLRLATIYPDSVHYEDNGQWKEIDNTLTAKIVDGQSVYINTSGLWDVRFPQRLNNSNSIAITKDGYTVSFGMAGEMRSSGDLVVASVGNELETNASTILPIIGGTIDSIAQVQPIDTATAKAEAEYAEIIPDKLHSRLLYPSVYKNTNIVYDLQSNQVKESIILRSFDSGLMGYRYTLKTGGLIPVLNADQSINLCDPDTDDIVMTMPAPFMLDANDEYCEDITVSLAQSGNSYILSYHLPVEWLSAEDRAWPVVLDPVVSANNARNNIQDITVAENGTESNNAGTIKCGYGPTMGIMRVYLRFKELPALSSADVIVNATITLRKPYNSTLSAPIQVHKVNTPWEASQLNWSNKPNFDSTVEDIVVVKDPLRYTWDITNIAFGWYADTTNLLQNNTGMVFKASDDIESAAQNNWQQFCSSDNTTFTDTLTPTSADTRPILTIEYITSDGLEDYWDYSSNSAGRAGTGDIQPYSGNLTWTHTDIGFDGNLMPVSISHIYNASDASRNTNLFGMGIGWRTNYNQRIIFDEDGLPIWEDGDGTPHVFVNDVNALRDADDLGLTLGLALDSDAEYVITDKYGNTSEFNSEGYLVKQTNSQQPQNSVIICYDSISPNLISQIEDGVGRRYQFEYENDNLLDKIIYYGTKTGIDDSPVTSISFSYSNSRLTTITYADKNTTTFAYTSKNLLSSATDIDGYKISYTYNTLHTGKPSRVVSVSEGTSEETGGSTTLSYTFNRTVMTDHNGNAQTYFFNCCGNTTSIQDSEGRATFYQYATDDPNTGIKNRLLKSSQQQDTVVNLIKDHSFENGTEWIAGSADANCENEEDTAYLGTHSLLSEYSGDYHGVSGASSGTYSVPAGTSVTFSAYVKLVTGSVQLLISGVPSGYAHSDLLDTPGEWTRMEVTYTNKTTSAVQITVAVSHISQGSAYIDCVQLERTSSASRYNLLENADISFSSYGWLTGGHNIGDEEVSASTPAPTLSATLIEFYNNDSYSKMITQTVQITGKAKDTFVFGGWTCKSSLSDGTGDRSFMVTINNNDGTQTTARVLPNPHIPNTADWQYILSSVTATKAYRSVTFTIKYGCDPNHIYVDGLQLFREPFAEEYKYDGKGNLTEMVNILGEKTVYAYNWQTNDLISIEEPTGIKTTYTYDDNHRVTDLKKEYRRTDYTWEEISEETYTYDTQGNVTEHVSCDNNVEKTTTYGYTSDGNFLAWTENALQNRTYYGYDLDNSTLEWIQYPNDTVSTRQTFRYDPYTFALTRTCANLESQMSAEYGYSYDRLTKIKTESTLYTLGYNDWGQRTSITAGNRNLATYTYTDDTDRYLSQLDYGNGNVVKYVYDDLGRVTQESYHASSTAAASRTVTYAYDSTGALVTVSDSKTGRTTKCYYDTVGRVDRQRTTDGTASHNLYYTYDPLGQITQVRETFRANNNTATEEFITTYGYANGRVIAVCNDGGTEASSSDDAYAFYTYDNFDRVTAKSVGTGPNSNQNVMGETLTYNELDQVTSLVLDAAGFDRTYTYKYDGNGNINKIIWGGKTIEYFYDSQNQLIRENNPITQKTCVWKYDAAGNILSESEYAYTTSSYPTQGYLSFTYQYANTAWGDLLTNYNGKTITYDAIGNPLSDGTWSYTWEQGRQLAVMSGGGQSWNFTYDADGLRTQRRNSNGGYTYTYTYSGGQLSRMSCGSHVMWFTYGADGKPLSVKYNGTTYYYVTNLQGDVIAILDSSGTAVVQYSYDAWGKLLDSSGSMEFTLGYHNPLRYRGYVYDRETGLYYLQSRYYNPEWGRFLNADSVLGTGDNLACYNLFAYCNNNPIMGYDFDGHWTWSWKDRAAFGAALLVAGIAILLAVPTGGASIAVGTIAISSTTAIATGGALAITGVIMIGDALIQADVSYAKKSRKSGKEKASDKPSWVSEKDVDLGKSSQRNASELLNNKYGSGNWGKGPGSEFNQIVKWIDRSLRGIVLFVTDRFMEEEL